MGFSSVIQSSMKHSVNIVLLGLFLTLTLCHGLPTDLDGKNEFSPEVRQGTNETDLPGLTSDELAELEHEVTLEMELDHKLEQELQLEVAELTGDTKITDRFWWLLQKQKKMTFFCPDGSTFKTKSWELGDRKKDCNVGSWTNNKGKKEICWKRGDGCSAGGSIMNNQFLASCDIHDVCYGVKNKSRSRCDSEFYYNMVHQCESENWPYGCYTLAGTAYSAVSVDPTGDAEGGYNWGQNHPCDW